MSCLRPQASMAYAWHSHAIHHCSLYTPQTTKSFSSTCMLQTNSCGLFNMRVCALLFFRWRTLQTFACASLKRRYGTGEKGQTLPGTCPTCSVAMPLSRGVSFSGRPWGVYPRRDTAHTSVASSNRTCHSCQHGTVFAARSAHIPGM